MTDTTKPCTIAQALADIRRKLESIRSTTSLGYQTGPYAYAGEDMGQYLRNATDDCRDILHSLSTLERSLAAGKVAKRARVQGYHGETIPWEVHGLAWEAYAKKYGSGQSAQRIHERGGFGTEELDTFLPDWRERVAKVDSPPADPAKASGSAPDVTDEAIERALDANIGLDKTLRELIRGDTMAVGYSKVDVVRALLAELGSTTTPPASAPEVTDAQCAAVYQAVTMANLTRDVKSEERKCAIVRASLHQEGKSHG